MPILFILIGSIFLGACSKKDDRYSSAQAWSLRQPILVSQTRGSSLSFKEIQLKRPDSLSSSDIIYFKDAIKKNTRLKIQTTCSLQEITKKHEVNIPLPSQISISEVLPPASRLNSSWICSFQFTAKHTGGSEHFFELKQYKINDDQINKIRLTYNPASDDSLTYVFGDLSYKTFIVSRGIGKVRIQCDGAIFTSEQMQRVQNLSAFIALENKDDEQNSLLCRAFEYSDQNRVVASSAKFGWSDKEPEVRVTEKNTRKTYMRYNRFKKTKPSPVMTWTINNSSEQNYFVALKNTSLKFYYELLNHKGSQGYFGSENLVFTNRLLGNRKNISEDSDYLIYEIPPGNSLKIDLMNYSVWDCKYNDHGIYLLPNLDTKLNAFVVDENMNVLKSLDLSFFEKKWIGRGHQPPRKSKGFLEPRKDHLGPRDEHGTLPGKSTQGKTKFCKLI